MSQQEKEGPQHEDGRRSLFRLVLENRPKTRVALGTVAGLMLLWPTGMALYQGVFWLLLGQLLIAGLVFNLFRELFAEAKKSPLNAASAVGTLLVIGWIVVNWGAWRSLLWDWLALGISMPAAYLALNPLAERFLPESRLTGVGLRSRDDLMGILMLVFAWICVSVFSVVRSQPLPVDPTRFERVTAAASIVPERAAAWSHKQVGVALSGGGYRAALFHTGTLHALETLGVRPHVLTTVSGGSIIGAYYALGGDVVAFKEAVARGRFNLKREFLLFHHAVRMALPLQLPGTRVKLWPWHDYNRLHVQAALLRRLLFNDREDWREPRPGQPQLMIAATDLTYGLLLGLGPDSLLVQTPDGFSDAYRRDAVSLQEDLDLADRVAISGAFPLAFPARPLGVRIAPVGATGTGERPLTLADGGIGDNLGLGLLQAAERLACREPECADGGPVADYSFPETWALDAILVSDASAVFGVSSGAGGAEAISRSFEVAAGAKQPRSDIRPVFFSPRNSYLDPITQFNLYQGEGREDPELNKWHLSFKPLLTPPPVLEALAALLPEADRKPAETLIEELVGAVSSSSLAELRELDMALHRLPAGQDCPLDSAAGLCPAARLRDLIEADVRAALGEFRDTSTLVDRIPRKRAETLFRLGQYLVYLRWTQLSRSLAGEQSLLMTILSPQSNPEPAS